MKPSSLQESKGALDLLEEAVHLLRRAPAGGLLLYYIGSVPFILALLFFWADMSRGAFANQRTASGALALALLFIWMKYWQARFCGKLRREIASTTPLGECPPKTPIMASVGSEIRQAFVQAVFHASGFLILPIAGLLSLPFGWVYAAYQNASVLAYSCQPTVRDLMRKSWAQALLWPKQNHLIIWLISPALLCAGAVIWLVAFPFLVSSGTDLSILVAYTLGFVLTGLILLLNPFGVIVAANLGIGLALLPELLRMFFGIETAFTRSGGHLLNSTFFAVICGLTYLCLDPIIKTVYTLRCFYGESLQTGADLRIEFAFLRRQAFKTALVTLIALATAGAMPAASPESSLSASPLPPRELDQSISEVLQNPEFTWRMPKETEFESAEPEGMIAAFLSNARKTMESWARKASDAVRRFFKWLLDSFKPKPPDRGETNWSWLGSLEFLLWLLVIVFACLLVFLMWRVWRRGRQRAMVLEEATPVIPDLNADNVSAGQLPEDSWLVMARELMARGELRLALRAFYLASLAHLADRGLIAVAKYKSNRDYERELARRAHALADVRALFSANVEAFDRVWYGRHQVDEDLLTGFAANVERIKAC